MGTPGAGTPVGNVDAPDLTRGNCHDDCRYSGDAASLCSDYAGGAICRRTRLPRYVYPAESRKDCEHYKPI